MSSRAGAFLLAITITIVLLVLICFLWYHVVGWQSFSYNIGDAPTWTPSGSRTIDYLRFKECTYTVVTPDGKSHPVDVTSNLNALAKSYTNSPVTPPPASLTLLTNLSPMSFTIKGINDSAANATTAGIATGKSGACTEDSQCAFGSTPGACSSVNVTSPSCTNGLASATLPNITVTLTGKYKTL